MFTSGYNDLITASFVTGNTSGKPVGDPVGKTPTCSLMKAMTTFS
jgi:hypothetical protein